MDNFPLPAALRDASSVLIAGAGGGFDIFAGLPLYAALRAEGKKVTLANLSFTYLGGTNVSPLLPTLYRIDAQSEASGAYFPEGVLAKFLASQGIDECVYAFDKTGVIPLQAAYEFIIAKEEIDAIVLVDGGTDILMRGDEAGLGTPEEDMASLAAAMQTKVKTKLVYCLGFGVDTYHGVCHAHFLENVAALAADGAFLGSTSLLAQMPGAKLYVDAVRFSEELMSDHPSIVNTSIASAIEGRFGNHHRTDRTAKSELFISPLMSMYWGFDLEALAKRNLYLESLYATQTIWDVQTEIQKFRSGLELRKRVAIPH
jgi:hypothetical protein